MKLIDISTPKHPNAFTIVDDADFDWLSKWKWHKSDHGYVRRHQCIDGKKITIYMHVEILKPPPGMRGDHRFGNKLDNRRENLRICTHAENNRNRRPSAGRNLPKGVDWKARERRFRAQISVNGRQIHLGYFDAVSEAEAVYVAAVKKHHGEFAFLGALVNLVEGSKA